ncbi:MAG: hypothetical protein LBK54_04815 [Propionibacteriaceae bacterium]|jgi:hypothetical protein|nr:hypothetical protein [Propionibacteriaceae bacterium]
MTSHHPLLPLALKPLALTAAVLSLLLTGCAGQPDPEPSDPATFPFPSASEATFSPTPTGPQPAGYSQYWTENQLAAVQVVERHNEIYTSIFRGETIQGDVIDFSPFQQVAAEVEVEETERYLRDFLSTGQRLTGEGVFTLLDPRSETVTADGRPQIVVRTCLDPSQTRILDSSGQDITPENRSSGAQDYTVQYLSDRQAWLVVLVRDVDVTC